MLCFLVPNLKEILSKKLTEIIITLTAEILLPDELIGAYSYHPGSTMF